MRFALYPVPRKPEKLLVFCPYSGLHARASWGRHAQPRDFERVEALEGGEVACARAEADCDGRDAEEDWRVRFSPRQQTGEGLAEEC